MIEDQLRRAQNPESKERGIVVRSDELKVPPGRREQKQKRNEKQSPHVQLGPWSGGSGLSTADPGSCVVFWWRGSRHRTRVKASTDGGPRHDLLLLLVLVVGHWRLKPSPSAADSMYRRFVHQPSPSRPPAGVLKKMDPYSVLVSMLSPLTGVECSCRIRLASVPIGEQASETARPPSPSKALSNLGADEVGRLLPMAQGCCPDS